MDNFWNSKNLLNVLTRWKWQILIITLVGMLVVGASTYLITPKYQSRAVLYPANLGTYSDENYTEQMMQVLQSRDIKDSLVKIYNLSEHYDLDSNYKHFQSVMYYFLNENISISRTEFEAVQIEVLDEDPQIAADMVYTIMDCYNRKVRNMHTKKIKERIRVNRQKIKRIEFVQDSITHRLGVLGSKYGIVNVESQSRELSAALYHSKISSGRYNQAKKQMENIQKYGGEFLNLTLKLESLMEGLAELKVEYEEQIVESQKKIVYYHLLTEPYPSDKKYSPRRIPITLLGGLSVFVLVLLIIGFVENNRYNLRD